MKVNLKAKPYNLSDEQISWVESTIDTMSVEEKIGQLFFLMCADPREASLDESLSIKPGGVMARPLPAQAVLGVHNYLQGNSRIPLFLAANLESGANGLFAEGTNVGHPLLIAATNDPTLAYKQGEVCIKESQALGGNMSFAPIIDINYNWDNPIANIRSFGDDHRRVSAMGQQYVDGVQDNGGFVTIKHFPGDGVDGRDQHVAKTINSLSYEDWFATFGRTYKENIDNGATGLMSGHIALPAYFEHNGITSEDKNTPASLSKVLLVDLLRGELGFNGLIMTDATLMTGFGGEGRRQDLVPLSIANGNDMFLFTKNIQEDYKFMMDGYNNGVITPERLEDALRRILGLKAKENLHLKDNTTPEATFQQYQKEHQQIAKDVADKGVTLVCDEGGILPLDKAKVKKIGIIFLGNQKDMAAEMSGSDKMGIHEEFGNLLTKEGFEVSFIDHSNFEAVIASMSQSVADFKNSYDLIIYFIKKDTKSNQTTVRLEFNSFIGFDAPWFVHEVPTMAVSVANPYHQIDLPNITTFINAYSPASHVVEAVVEKMMGRSTFKGISPVKLDFSPFTGSLDRWK